MSHPAGAEAGTHFARSRALAVLRIRSTALAAALLPAAIAVILYVAAATGRLTAPGWDVVRWASLAAAALALLLASVVTAVLVRARPAVSPTVPIPEETAPELYRLVRDLAERLDVPAPSAIALTPDCDSWLEDRTHRAHRAAHAHRRSRAARDAGGTGSTGGLRGAGTARTAGAAGTPRVPRPASVPASAGTGARGVG
ncbi:hypothetical protein ACSNOD_29765, partial [Streptomyces sp. URMC 123]